jgi:hypothetical protein
MPFFSRTCAVLMSAYDGGVNHHVFVIVITRQQLENTLENSTLRPSTEALMNRFPVTETLWQITPGTPRPKSVKNRFDEQPVIFCRAAHVSFTSWQKILNPIPLIVA